MEDPARYLAARLVAECALPRPADTDALLGACRLRGVSVARSWRLSRPGVYVPELGLVVLAGWAGPRALAHELFHALVHDNRACGIWYHAPHWATGDEERQAERFARMLCGE